MPKRAPRKPRYSHSGLDLDDFFIVSQPFDPFACSVEEFRKRLLDIRNSFKTPLTPKSAIIQLLNLDKNYKRDLKDQPEKLSSILFMFSFLESLYVEFMSEHTPQGILHVYNQQFIGSNQSLFGKEAEDEQETDSTDKVININLNVDSDFAKELERLNEPKND